MPEIIFTEEDLTEECSLLKESVIKGFMPQASDEEPPIIKVIGVGGGGGNAVTHMYKEGIHNVTFMLCNTDKQALRKSEVPIKVQLGKKGLGAGNIPQKAKEAAEESIEVVKDMLNDGTEMVFITAGMGGGTGTGAGPIVAKVAKEMGILTIGIVTIPFVFERMPKILQALKGVEEIKKNVDALLVINNQRLFDVYSDLSLDNAFEKADDILTVAAKSIAEIITIAGPINLDFADVRTTLEDGGVTIMSSGLGKGDNRISTAIDNALKSPLLNNDDIFKAKKILLNISYSNKQPVMTSEADKEITKFMAKFNPDIDVIWGTSKDESLDGNVKITILATGFEIEDIPLDGDVIRAKKLEDTRKLGQYYDREHIGVLTGEKPIYPQPFIFTYENMDDDETIDTIIGYRAYDRSESVVSTIKKRANERL